MENIRDNPFIFEYNQKEGKPNFEMVDFLR